MTLLALALAGCSRGPDLGREYTEPVDILDADGRVQARGWARRPLFGFDRDVVPEVLRGRIREWDFYNVYTPDFAVAVTLAEIRLGDADPLVLGAVTVHDYPTGRMLGPSIVTLDGADMHTFDPDPGGTYAVDFASTALSYGLDGDARTIALSADDASAELRIEPVADESIALVTPYADDGQFFYENKQLPMPASGFVQIGDERWDLPSGSFAVLDFVRGVMPAEITWTWATALGEVDGRLVGINLGSVGGDEAGGTPDAVIVDGRLHKLPRVTWSFDLDDPLQPWTFASEDGRADLRLEPDHGYVERNTTSLGTYRVDLWKLYGRWSGTVELDDGARLELDGLVGAAEVMETAW